jgi:hypothetical protein
MTKSQAAKLGLQGFDSPAKTGLGASLEREWPEVCVYLLAYVYALLGMLVCLVAWF